MIPADLYSRFSSARSCGVTRIRASSQDYTSLKTVTFGDESAVRPNRAAVDHFRPDIFLIWGMFTAPT